jgi:hypothetical protein
MSEQWPSVVALGLPYNDEKGNPQTSLTQNFGEMQTSPSAPSPWPDSGTYVDDGTAWILPYIAQIWSQICPAPDQGVAGPAQLGAGAGIIGARLILGND